MIGHYLLTLTPVEEGRVLTRKMGAILRRAGHLGNECLLMVVNDVKLGTYAYMDWEAVIAITERWRHHWRSHEGTFIGTHYDKLCERFTTDRINAAIRNRILSNQARRALVPEGELVLVAR